MSWHRRPYRPVLTTIPVFGVVVLGFGCAGLDNPSSRSDLTPTVTVDVGAISPETFEEVEVKASVVDGGHSTSIREANLEFEPAGGGDPVTIEMEGHEGGIPMLPRRRSIDRYQVRAVAAYVWTLNRRNQAPDRRVP